MKLINKKSAALIAAAIVTFTMSGCSRANTGDIGQPGDIGEITLPEDTIPGETLPDTELPELPEESPVQPPEEVPDETPAEEEPPAEVPTVNTVSYIVVTTNGVNIRTGAGTGYSAMGTAENSTLYAYGGKSGDWYKTNYLNRAAFISGKYCGIVGMTSSDNENIENVIAEGTKLLGTPYVYSAVRYHDGSGRLLQGFTISKFDCSSLMQYIFKKGAGVNLQVNTRTQIYQGKTVTRSELKRGDLMFFTNASRKNNTGIERVGHVALYLGDNWILHTASDYAKIEQISPLRWSYFIQGQRIL